MAPTRASLWAHVAWMRSDSEPGTRHEIKRHKHTGTLGCDCGRYRFARGVKTCHHIERWLTGGEAAVAARLRENHVTAADTPIEVRVAADTYTFTRRSMTFGGRLGEGL